MNVTPTRLPEVLIIRPDVRGDERGYFLELWRQEAYLFGGQPRAFVQDNLSYSVKGTLRGLHFQNPVPQAKLVTVLEGEVYDVAVDVRRDSERFGRWVGIRLNSSDKHQLYIPEGFAHGFTVLSESALVHYKCTAPYRAEAERVFRWNDAQIGIEWPVDDPLLSARDAAAPALSVIDPKHLTFLPGT